MENFQMNFQMAASRSIVPSAVAWKIELRKQIDLAIQQKMNVSLEAQTISASVADSLEFARKRLQLEDFEDSEVTEIFLRTSERVFDTLKVSSRVEGSNQQQ